MSGEVITNRESGATMLSAKLDSVGMVASCACAVHCAVMPFIFSVLPLLGLRVLADERTEWLLIAMSAVIGTMSLLPAYVRHHRCKLPLAIFAAGLTLIGVGRIAFAEDVLTELVMVSIGALLIATSHFFNRRSCQMCCPHR